MYRQDKLYLAFRNKDIMKYLAFRLDVAEESFLSIAKDEESENSGEECDGDNNDRPKSKRQRTVPIPPSQRRTAGNKHLPEMDDIPLAMRCRQKDCKGRSRVRCSSCNVYLCLTTKRNCFKEFHE